MQRWALLGCKVGVIAALTISLVLQISVFPFLASQVVRTFPEAGHLRIPGILGAVGLVACGQVILVAMWRLLTLARRGQAFQPSAIRIVDVIIWAAAAAAVLSKAALTMLMLNRTLPPSVLILLASTGIGGIGAVLLVTVLRGLLLQAVESATELSQVV